jgi:hypothetical protein
MRLDATDSVSPLTLKDMYKRVRMIVSEGPTSVPGEYCLMGAAQQHRASSLRTQLRSDPGASTLTHGRELGTKLWRGTATRALGPAAARCVSRVADGPQQPQPRCPRARGAALIPRRLAVLIGAERARLKFLCVGHAACSPAEAAYGSRPQPTLCRPTSLVASRGYQLHGNGVIIRARCGRR